MKRGMVAGSFFAMVLFAWTASLQAEVKTEEKTQFKMEGMMGSLMGMFGGQSAKEGLVSTNAVKGNRKITTGDNTSEIVDLDEQKIYELDLKKKRYRVVTFEEMRRQIRKAQENAAKSVKDEDKGQPEKEMEFEFSIKESGQTRTINGYDCREVIMTVTGRQKGKSLDQGGGMVMTSHIWVGPEIPALKEMSDFDLRYAKALDIGFGAGGSAEQIAIATAMYPGMKEMMAKMESENVNMKGAQILVETTMEMVKDPAEVSREQKQEEEDSGVSPVRGLGGMLGRRLSRKKESEENTGKAKNRSNVFTTRIELMKVSTAVPDSDLAIPANFKEKK